MTIRPLCPELIEKAQTELNEDPKRIVSDLEHIKDWLSKQPHIHARPDEQWLLAFLRGCKYSLERTKERLDLHYSLPTFAPELYRVKHDDLLFDELLDLGSCIVLPKCKSVDSPRIVIIRPGVVNPEKIDMCDYFAVISMIHKILLVDDDTAVVNGVQWIVDLEGITIMHVLQVTPTVMKKMILQSQDASPMRTKGAFYINSPPIFEKVMNVLKSILNEKNKNRQFVYNKDIEGLYQHIPKSILPTEYGGNIGTIKEISENFKAKKQAYSSWLEEESKFKTDEAKRPGKPKTAESMFGIEGSFRQMELD